ncbi:MAG: hypothetical protein U1E39_00510 [Planctomycetota bacterium]
MGERGRTRALGIVLVAVTALGVGAVVFLGTRGPAAVEAPDRRVPSAPDTEPEGRVVLAAWPPPGVSATEFRATFVAFREGVPLLDPRRRETGRPARAVLRVAAGRTATTVHALANGFVSGPRHVDGVATGTAAELRFDDWRPATTVRVSALDRDGRPLAGATLRVARSSPGGDAVEPAQYLSATTDAAGRRDVTVFPGEPCRISGSHDDARGSATPVLLDASRTVPGAVLDVTLRFP